jgi:AraC-like DNA-binding protein
VGERRAQDDCVLINPPAEAIGQRNALMSQTSEKHLHQVVGALSIKWMPIGWSVWRTAAGTYRIAGDHFLVLNHGRAYSLSRQPGEPQESFCPFFARGFVEAAHRDLVRADDRLLSDGAGAPPPALEFREQLYGADTGVLPQLRRMWTALRSGAAADDWLEDGFHVLAERLLHTRPEVERAIDRLPARRAATREELHRRLQRGREFIHAHFAERMGLDEIARAACLAPHHFHRLFRAAFQHTPHAYCTALRLQRAETLLARTAQSVTEICYAVGFESVGSFSALFHRRVGLSPSAFRAASRPGGGRRWVGATPEPAAESPSAFRKNREAIVGIRW